MVICCSPVSPLLRFHSTITLNKIEYSKTIESKLRAVQPTFRFQRIKKKPICSANSSLLHCQQERSIFSDSDFDDFLTCNQKNVHHSTNRPFSIRILVLFPIPVFGFGLVPHTDAAHPPQIVQEETLQTVPSSPPSGWKRSAGLGFGGLGGRFGWFEQFRFGGSCGPGPQAAPQAGLPQRQGRSWNVQLCAFAIQSIIIVRLCMICTTPPLSLVENQSNANFLFLF